MNPGLTVLQEEAKDSMRKKRKRKSPAGIDSDSLENPSKGAQAGRKRVSFA